MTLLNSTKINRKYKSFDSLFNKREIIQNNIKSNSQN